MPTNSMQAIEVKDETPVSIEVRERDETVVLVFDKAVSWIGVQPLQALKISEQIKTAAVGILRSQPKTN